MRRSRGDTDDATDPARRHRATAGDARATPAGHLAGCPGAAGAELGAVEAALLADPLFLDEETIVIPVASVAAPEAEERGAVLERWGTAGLTAHQHFLLEARFDLAAVTAQVMLAAARAIPSLRPGAHTLPDLLPGLLQGAAARS